MTAHWQYYLSNSGALLKETVSFGVSVGLLSSTVERAWDDRVIELVAPGGSLELHLLSLMGKLQEPDQRIFRGVHDHLVDQGVYFTSVSDVLERMERTPARDLFKWNITKVNFWSHFMHDLGLLVRLPPERIVMSPVSTLLRDALAQSSPDGDLRRLLERWHVEYFSVFTRLGEVHEGTARALLRLEQSGTLELRYASDAVGSLLLCGRRVSHYHVRMQVDALAGGTYVATA